MSDSTSGPTGTGDGMRYRSIHTVKLSDIAKKFEGQDRTCSPPFFCHEDPESPFFELVLVYGQEEGFLGVYMKVSSDTKKAFLYTNVKFRLYDIKGTLLANRKIANKSPWRKFGDQGWGLGRVYKPVDASAETEWKLFVEFEYEKQGVTLPSSTSSHDFQADLLKLLETPDADVTFIVQGQPIKAHKNILSVRSQYFQRMFDSDVEENIKDEVKVPDVEPEIFRGLLRFLYSGLAPENVTDKALDLLLAADKYGVDGLKQICEEKASIHRDNVVDALLVADSIQNEKIMSRAKAVFRSHVDELRASVDETNRLPRALLLELISHYAKQ